MVELSSIETMTSTIASERETDPATRQVTKNALARVAFIVGSNDARHCGVKDYAYTLAEALARERVHADVLAPRAWNLSSWHEFRSEVLQTGQYDIIHVQYPSIGFRYSLLPHALGLFRDSHATVVTLHECSALPISQRLSLQAFRATASLLLLSSEYEQTAFNGRLGQLGARQEVVPIGSNVPAFPGTGSWDSTVAYFGQIRPDKGLEAYLDLARLSIAMSKSFKFHVMGSISKANEQYAKALMTQAPPEVQWSLDLPFEEVGRILCKSLAAYLPFPDGASERRGSMLAALLNGLPVLSREGEATTQPLKDLLIMVHNQDEALRELEDLERQPSERVRLSHASKMYAQMHSWENVAKRHVEFYISLLKK